MHPPANSSEDAVGDFVQLRVWQSAHSFALRAYRFTTTFPADERFGLTSQIRRAAISIGANIAESCGRSHDADQARFLQMAKGSAKELRSHLMIARDLGFLAASEQQPADATLEQIERMLTSLLRNARRTSSGFRPPASGGRSRASGAK
jgi:four helix bundle protein